MRLALFDLDHTLLPIDSADTWSHFVVENGGLDAALYGARIREFSRTYQAGTFDIEGYVAFQMELLALFPRSVLDGWHSQFMDEHVRPHIRREALDLVDSHRKLGDELALVTGTNAYVVTPIAREFGIDHVLAVQPEVERDESGFDRFTGGHVGTHTYQEGKVRKVGEWLAARGRDWEDTTTICYGDSINDLPLLERATTPIATNADARLRAIARERGWQTLELFAPTLAPAT
ncbi:MAG: HAD-IB family hydrolase [Burkholderiaceae bacterium]|nr:HAD-IB family hydrolase [Burkholderiaceae bacterium]